MKRTIILGVVLLTVLFAWAGYLSMNQLWGLFQDNWFMSLTMVFGSFIAGASSEGGGAIAFPVMTLIFEMKPAIARNFSLAIQSVGMTAAAFFILVNRIQIELKFIAIVSLGGAIGMVLGSYFLIDVINPASTKLLFVCLWLSFGLVLFYMNEIKQRDTASTLNLNGMKATLSAIFIGLIGGAISSMLGSGIDILCFAFLTLRYRVSEKIATPTSVVMMAINSIVGFAMHILVLKDFGVAEFNYWLACIPVVIVGAPLGAYLISKRTKQFIAKFLYLIIVVQFIGALIILTPSASLLLFSALVFVVGCILFFSFNWLGKRD